MKGDFAPVLGGKLGMEQGGGNSDQAVW